MRNLVILLPMTWSIRNIVTSGLVEQLDSCGLNVTLLAWRTEGFVNILPEGSRIQVQPLLMPGKGERVFAAGFLNEVMAKAFQRRHRLNGQWSSTRKVWRQLQGRSALRSLAADMLAFACQSPVLYGRAARLAARVYRSQNDLAPIRQQLQMLRPDFLCSTACVNGKEQGYLRAAEDLKLRTIGCINSFDNLTSRGEIPVFDYCTAWNQRMQDTLVRMYPQVNQANVFITGTPQFDFHRRADFQWTREETLRRLGLPPGARYVLYAANCDTWTPTEPELVSLFAERLARTKDLSDLWIVVRLHPLDKLSRWQGHNRSGGNLVVCAPWVTQLDADGWAAVTAEDQRLLVSSFAHSEACVNMASTAALDAAILDRPVIGISFASVAGSAESKLYCEAHQSLHYKPLVESGGLRLAKNWDDLLALVRRAIEQPGCDRQERQKMVERECGVVDGHATDRMLEVFKSLPVKHAVPSAVRDSAACPSACQ